ncbi:LysR family transcriptional regulator [Kiloniella sp. b19]|uniref:LysR family transcriptional regulator n=1 Tax=Kiloniella sp. GXU_MW_B19 TaxID=3141326 RepID=UPI0031E3E42D
MRSLPSEKSFQLLDCCARLESFTAAADELGITQSAVSQQVRALEESMEVRFFDRIGRRVVLSEAGRRVLKAASEGFGQIRQAILDETESHRANSLSIAVLPGFFVRWLLPRLIQFRARHPEIKLEIKTVSETSDFRKLQTHAAIQYGVFPDQNPLFREAFTPVASPAFAAEHGLALSSSAKEASDREVMQRILKLPLLGESMDSLVGTGKASAPDLWHHWARAYDLPLGQADIQHFSQSNITLQLAELGQGIALGRCSLIQDAFRKGELVPLIKQKQPSPYSYYLTRNPHMKVPPFFETFSLWLEEAVQEISGSN